jgi:hypothetical protein
MKKTEKAGSAGTLFLSPSILTNTRKEDYDSV